MPAGQEYTRCPPEQEARCHQHGQLAMMHEALGDALLCRELMRTERDSAIDEMARLRREIQLTPEEQKRLGGREDGLVPLAFVRAYLDRIGVEF